MSFCIKQFISISFCAYFCSVPIVKWKSVTSFAFYYFGKINNGHIAFAKFRSSDFSLKHKQRSGGPAEVDDTQGVKESIIDAYHNTCD